MISSYFAFLALAFQTIQPVSVVGPGYLPNAVQGSTVVAEFQFAPGMEPKLRILTEGGAFADAARTALEQWQFDAGRNGRKSSLLVVLHFRDPNFYSSGPATRDLDRPKNDLSVPFPVRVLDPVFPVNTLTEGSVIMRAEVLPSGKVGETEIIQGQSGLDAASLDAVKQWTFIPARDEAGKPTACTIFAVIIYRIPVSAPVAPSVP